MSLFCLADLHRKNSPTGLKRLSAAVESQRAGKSWFFLLESSWPYVVCFMYKGWIAEFFKQHLLFFFWEIPPIFALYSFYIKVANFLREKTCLDQLFFIFTFFWRACCVFVFFVFLFNCHWFYIFFLVFFLIH